MLYIDDRQGSKEMIDREELAGEELELTRLEYCDVMMIGEGPRGEVGVGVEIKRTGEFLTSCETGRLFGHQIPGLIENYDVRYVAVVDKFRQCPGSGALQIRKGQRGRWKDHAYRPDAVTPQHIEAMLLSVSATGCYPRTFESFADLCIWLRALHAWWKKPWSRHSSAQVLYCGVSTIADMRAALDPQVEMRARFAKQISGLGYKRAVSAALKFPSIRAMANAEVEEWEEVEGVGRVLAKKAVEALTGRAVR